MNDTGDGEEYCFYVDNYNDGASMEFYLYRDYGDDVAAYYCPYDEYYSTFGATMSDENFTAMFQIS